MLDQIEDLAETARAFLQIYNRTYVSLQTSPTRGQEFQTMLASLAMSGALQRFDKAHETGVSENEPAHGDPIDDTRVDLYDDGSTTI